MSKVSVDLDHFRTLYDSGMTDLEIGKRLGFSITTAGKIRGSLGLPTIKSKGRKRAACRGCGSLFESCVSAKRIYCTDQCYRQDVATRMAAKPVKVPRIPGTHRESATRLHKLWCGMKTRCSLKSNNAAYKKYYAGRGISVCDEWSKSFEAFRDWALANGYADDLEIDRIDNDKGYSPGNCRWATRSQQMQNTRKSSAATTSKYRGVSRHSQNGRWIAQLCRPGKSSYVGSFGTEEEAARAYDAAAKLHFREFASLNFKEDCHARA